MTTLRNIRTLTRYTAWTNDRIFDAVAALPEGEATKPRRSVFKNIVHTLNHVYVIDLIFQAHSPGGAAPLGPFMPVEAILPIESGHPYKAVRVRGSTNAVTLKTIPGYAEAAGYEEAAPAKQDCAKCLGKYFVAKGANPPAGVAADQIVREADLPWVLRVTQPTDGVPSYTFNPNRLTLVLSDDGRIVDAAWD